MPGNCAIYRSWITGDSLTAADLTQSLTTVGVTNMTPQCLDDYSFSSTQMQSVVDPYPNGAPSLATSTAGELERLRYVIKLLTGWTHWYTHTEPINIADSGNYTYNGDFEVWGAGTSAAPTGWREQNSPAATARNTTAGQFRRGTASVQVTSGATTCSLRQDVHSHYPPIGYWKGVKLTFGAWVRTTSASSVNLIIDDTATSTQGSFHTGGGSFEWLQVTHTVSQSATTLEIGLRVVSGGVVAQMDGATLVYGGRIDRDLPSSWQGRKCVMQFHSNGTIAAGATNYIGNGVSGTEALVQLRVPFKCVVRNLHCHSGAAAGAGETFTYTLRKNAGATSPLLTCTINGASETEDADVTNEDEFAKGDLINVRVVASGSAAVTQHTATVEIEEIP